MEADQELTELKMKREERRRVREEEEHRREEEEHQKLAKEEVKRFTIETSSLMAATGLLTSTWIHLLRI